MDKTVSEAVNNAGGEYFLRSPGPDFIKNARWGNAQQIPLPCDASNRRYIRLIQNDKQVLLMDAPPPHEDVRPFIKVANFLSSHGFSAPEIIGADPEHGFLIIEDFGFDTFTNLLADNADEHDLYALATDTLIALHTTTSVPSWAEPYDHARLTIEAALLPDWFLPASGVEVSAAARFEYDLAWQAVFSHLPTTPSTLVLRDFHVDNLMRLPGRSGTAACGLLDFQDALAGHPAYDLMSLLEDARRDVPVPIQAAMKARYHSALGTPDISDFDTAYAILAAARHAKIIGIFTRLDRRDGKPQYLGHLDRVWGHLSRHLQHPVLAPVKSWFETHVLTQVSEHVQAPVRP